MLFKDQTEHAINFTQFQVKGIKPDLRTCTISLNHCVFQLSWSRFSVDIRIRMCHHMPVETQNK